MMDQFAERIKQITGELKEYIEARIDLMVLNIGEQITQWIGESIQKVIGYTVLGSGIFFLMMAWAIFLGDLLENLALGYLITAVPLMIIGALLASAKPRGLSKSIQNQFMDGILKSIDKKKEDKALQLPEKPGKQLTQGHEQKNR